TAASRSSAKQSGSLMNASTTVVSRLNQSNGVRAGSKGPFRMLVPAGADVASCASLSRAPDPERMSPSIFLLWSSTYCCAAKEPMLGPIRMKWAIGVLLLGDAAQPHHVLHQQIKAALAEISETRSRGCRVAVSAVIVAVDSQAGWYPGVDQLDAPPDGSAHTMRTLDHSAPGLP